jgi:hypothetical protein
MQAVRKSATPTGEAVTAVFGDGGPDGRHVPDLMTQRLRVVAVKRLLAMAADRRFAVVDGVGVIDEGTLDLGVPVLTARFVAGRRLGRGAFEARRVGGGWLGGIGGVLLQSGFEVGEASFVSLDQSADIDQFIHSLMAMSQEFGGFVDCCPHLGEQIAYHFNQMAAAINNDGS